MIPKVHFDPKSMKKIYYIPPKDNSSLVQANPSFFNCALQNMNPSSLTFLATPRPFEVMKQKETKYLGSKSLLLL